MSYIDEIRGLVGNRPLILPGAAVLCWTPRAEFCCSEGPIWTSGACRAASWNQASRLSRHARRELREETGLEVDELSLVGLLSGPDFFHVYANGDQVYNVTATYLATKPRGELKAEGIEGTAVLFFALNDLPTERISPKLIERLLELTAHVKR